MSPLSFCPSSVDPVYKDIVVRFLWSCGIIRFSKRVNGVFVLRHRGVSQQLIFCAALEIIITQPQSVIDHVQDGPLLSSSNPMWLRRNPCVVSMLKDQYVKIRLRNEATINDVERL